MIELLIRLPDLKKELVLQAKTDPRARRYLIDQIGQVGVRVLLDHLEKDERD